jgi:hypothetical protein
MGQKGKLPPSSVSLDNSTKQVCFEFFRMQWAALVRVSPMHAEIQIVQYLDSFLKYANQSIENEAEREQKRTY